MALQQRCQCPGVTDVKKPDMIHVGEGHILSSGGDRPQLAFWGFSL